MTPLSTIRPATPDDAPALVAIVTPIIERTAISFEYQPPTIDAMRQRIEDTVQRLPWLVGVDTAGAVNGFVNAGKHRDAPSYQWSVNTSVYIREDARGQGVGGELYRALFDALVRLGYFRAYAGIALPNAASVALHESVGFEPLGVYRDVGFKFGAWHDVGWWQRRLREGTPGELLPFAGGAPPAAPPG